ncbi:hypothetical protein FACS1894106_1890 [Spirochaetia bacterium]|nr:hypothetical protein FACS1894106_1890 [Spirochaetia bacterium]
MKRIDDISVFGEYKQPENRVTAAFLQICKIGGEGLIRTIAVKLNIQLPNSEIDIFSQVKEEDAVPDGLLESNFSFKIYIESKIKKNAVNKRQLKGHIKALKKENDFLIYLTPDEELPIELRGERVSWANWKTVNDIITDYVQDLQTEEKQLLDFLCQQFKTLLDNLDLCGYDWDFDNKNVIILAGRTGEQIALQYFYYICQNKRKFKPARYLTFFNNNQFRHIFEIVEKPKDDVNLNTIPELKEFVESLEEEKQNNLHTIIKLKYFKEIEPIKNDTIDKNGDPCPYIYGITRYTTLQKMENAKKTSEL